MDDGEVDLSSHLRFLNPESPSSFDEFLMNTRTCTHTHTCNPPGPAASAHTHTCYHTHTQVLAPSEGEGDDEVTKKPRKPLGNREAVRKYREKKKAHTAYLEEEVKKLRLQNQQLVARLQRQAALEAEAVRLRSLLVDLRVKIDGELGVYPFQKQCTTANFQCNENTLWTVGGTEVAGWQGGCIPPAVECQISPNENVRQDFEISEAINSMNVNRSLTSNTF